MWGAQWGPMRPFGGGGGFIVGNEGERGWSAVKGGKQLEILNYLSTE